MANIELLADLDLPLRAQNCLASGGYVTVDQVKKAMDYELLRVPNMGRKTVRVIRETIAELDAKEEVVRAGLKPIQDAIWVAADIRAVALTSVDTHVIAFAAVEAMREVTAGMRYWEKLMWQERIDSLLRGEAVLMRGETT